MKRTILIVFLYLACIFQPLQAGEVHKAFGRKEFLKLTAILGSCKIEQSTDDSIRIDVRYTFDDEEFRAVFSELQDSLLLKEEFSEKSPIGVSSWMIAVPKNSRLFISSATGDIAVERVHSEIKAETGTGSVDIEESTGIFEFASGTSSVTGRNLLINGDSRFTSGTGSVRIGLALGSNHDITVASGTSDATLEFGGNPLQGRFEFITKHGLGRIVSPVPFEREEMKSDKHFQYEIKSFSAGGRNMPRIRIETGSGTAKLVQ